MIDQTFADVATPLIRQRLARLGYHTPNVPVLVRPKFSWEDFVPEDDAERAFYEVWHPEVLDHAQGVTNYVPYSQGVVQDIRLQAKQLNYAAAMHARAQYGVGPFSEYAWAAAVLQHELIHTAMPPNEGHDELFTAAYRHAGMVGPSTTSIPGWEYAQWVEDVIVPAYKKVADPLALPELRALGQRRRDARLQGRRGPHGGDDQWMTSPSPTSSRALGRVPSLAGRRPGRRW